MKRFLFITAFFAVLASSSAAFAFNPLYSCGGGDYAAWPPGEVPVNYWITSSGSASVPMATVQSVFASSFSEWGGPCCSSFGGSYQGTTSSNPWEANGSRPVILGFTQSSWDPSWGSTNSTIGVTLVRPGFGCSLDQAPIVFNEIGFNFTTQGGGTDLESIATHEIGHLLGLDHSPFDDATMYAAYTGGVGARTLHQDDREGVCELYFAAACSCTTTSQCGSGEVCMGNVCRLPPCSTNADCDDGLSCLPNGDCGIPPCNSDADCIEGYRCSQNRCVSDCPVCRTCSSDADCAGVSAQCIDLGEGMRCHVFCDLNATVPDLVCPGDSSCWNFPDGQGGFVPVCGSPAADVAGGLCSAGTELNPVNYVCIDDGTYDECASGADCPDGASCISTPEGRRCDIPDLCADVVCGEGLTCDPARGFCIRDENPSNNTPGNNTPGNNTPGNNTPGNNSSGNNANNGGGPGNNDNGGNPDDDPIIIVRANDPEPESGCCAVTSPRDVPGTLVLLIGLLGFVRRRR